VDLRVEVEGLRLLDVSEFHHLATEAICEGRIRIASLLSYAEARLLTIQDLFGNEQSLSPKNLENLELVDLAYASHDKSVYAFIT